MRALVLRKTSFSESDLIVEFFLENGMRQSGFAPGARRSKKRFPHQFYPAAIYEVEWSKPAVNGQLTRLKSCEVLESYPRFSNDLHSVARWATVQEWMLEEQHEVLFEDLCQLLRSLLEERHPLSYHLFFLKQIAEHGISPRFENCVVCRKQVEEEFMQFHLGEAGVAHSKCFQGRKMSQKVLGFLKSCFELSDFNSAQRFAYEFSESDWQDLHEITLPFLQYQMGRHLKSHQFLQSLGSSSAPNFA